MARRKGLVYDLTLEQYKASWRALYPDKPVPLTSEGEPVDHALDPNHPCPDVPWLQEFLIYHQPSGEHFSFCFFFKILTSWLVIRIIIRRCYKP
jgi:hypothetical protein